MVDTMTDNKVRTVAEVRHALSKHGGNLGSDGSVAYQFKHCGQFIFAPGADEDRLMEVALEAGADDVINSEDGAMEVLCSPNMFEPVKIALEGAQLLAVLAEITYRPEISVALAAADAEKMQKILDVLDELDDVQEVYHNAEL
jgi:transcriptional/translational regulatory protein YebC/TACO1